ncbi:hypothetical protein [Xanthobacter wiegelii]|uniref:hypothetical protein n=1 Tax=Xanthobacter wiegelii TaxID=3119913 RepID=UPI0037264CF1
MELILSEVQFDPFADTLFACGSIVEGFHNCFSDLDILIIGDQPQADRRSSTFYIAGLSRWVDIAWLSELEINEIAAKLNAAGPIGWHARPALSLQEYDLAHRIKLAVPLTNLAAERYHDLKKSFLGPQLCRSLCHSYTRAARARWYDAIGAFESHQFRQAHHVMRICHSLSIDGMLALFGETNPSDKWRWAKLNRAADAIREKGVSFDPDPPCDDLEHFMRETAALMFDLTALYHGREIQRPPVPVVATSRYEHTPDGLYVLHANGHQELVI